MRNTSTVLFASLGVGAAITAIALSQRRRPPLGYTNVDEVYPPAAPPPPPPPPPTPAAAPIPSFPVDLPAAVKSPTPLEIEQAVIEMSRGPQFTPAAPPPPPPSGTPDSSFAASAVHDLLRPATTSAQRSPRQAAADLYNYVTEAIRGNELGKLGTRAAPVNYIANAQRDMRLIASDGVYGPKTRARGKELLGREFPEASPAKRRVTIPATLINQLPAASAAVLALPPPEPPPLSATVSQHSPREAAAALFELVTHPPVHWGSRAKPNELIRRAQRDMQGIAADGIYGPKTRARGKLLLGREFPSEKASVS